MKNKVAKSINPVTCQQTSCIEDLLCDQPTLSAYHVPCIQVLSLHPHTSPTATPCSSRWHFLTFLQSQTFQVTSQDHTLGLPDFKPRALPTLSFKIKRVVLPFQSLFQQLAGTEQGAEAPSRPLKIKPRLHCVQSPTEASFPVLKAVPISKCSLSPRAVAAAPPCTAREKQNRLLEQLNITWEAQRD